MHINFIPITQENSQHAFNIHRQSQFKPWSRKIFDDCLSAPYFAYYASSNNIEHGYFIGMKVLDEMTLMDIAVSQKIRGRGIGRHLLNYFIDQCRQQGIVQVWLEVRESNQTAINLYHSTGFDVVETRMNYYPSATGNENALIMCLYLEQGGEAV